MVIIEGVAKKVLEKSEWVAVATAGPNGPHVVATWSEYIIALGIREGRLLIPVGAMHNTEANLKTDNRIELLCATRQVKGSHGPGKGCSITGTAHMEAEGEDYEAVHSRFPWARAALVVQVEKIEPQL
jgi:hypothetical protein